MSVSCSACLAANVRATDLVSNGILSKFFLSSVCGHDEKMTMKHNFSVMFHYSIKNILFKVLYNCIA